MANTLAYGFLRRPDLWNERVQSVGEGLVDSMIAESVNEHSRQIAALTAGWMDRTTLIQEKVLLPDTGSMQPIGPDGSPRPVNQVSSYTAGYPLYGGGTGWTADRLTIDELTVQEVQRRTILAMDTDAESMATNMLSSIFINTDGSFEDDQLGSITVRSLANADTVKYQRRGAGAPSTDNHYLAQAGAIADATNPFPTLYRELYEHPSNQGPFVAYVPTNVVDAIEGLSDFVEDTPAEILKGANSDQLRAGLASQVIGPGTRVLGFCNRMFIVEWARLPDNYIIAVASGRSFLKMRELPSPRQQGLFLETDRTKQYQHVYNYLRFNGYGVYNRVGAAVMRVSNGSYAIPTGYDARFA